MLAVAGLVPFYLVAFFTPIGPAAYIGHPDPAVPDGDPCCGHPDTWGEVAAGVALTLAGWVLAGLIAVGLWWLAVVAVRGRTSRLRLRAIPLGMLGAVLLLVAYLVVIAVLTAGAAI